MQMGALPSQGGGRGARLVHPGQRGRPKPTKEVHLWDAILAASTAHKNQQLPPTTHWKRNPAPSTSTAGPASTAPAAASRATKTPAHRPAGDSTIYQDGKTSTTTAKGAGAAPAPRKSKSKQRQENTNWASNQRHIAFRGKERETPKPPKPSKLKRVILIERAKADALRYPPPPPSPVLPASPPPEAVEEPYTLQHRPDGLTGLAGRHEEIHAQGTTHSEAGPVKMRDEVHEGEALEEDMMLGEEYSCSAHAAAITSVALEIDYNSPPPSPPPGAAEIQSIDATYCKQIISVELNQVTRQLLQELTRFQQRLRSKDPDKARAKKRYVCGLREVLRSVERKKAKCVIVTPNIERISSPEGGLFEAVEAIVRASQQNRVTVVFAMTRTSLGKATSKRLKIAALAILDPSGAEEYYKQALALAHKGRTEYRRMHKRKSQHVPRSMPRPPVGLAPVDCPQQQQQQQQPLAEILPRLLQRAIEEHERTEPRLVTQSPTAEQQKNTE